jgi:BirA family biotin operon repressor/biotin-[acetyl-CoA-carboxylase] ligase
MIIHAVRGKGYRLAAPIDWLDAETLLASVPDAVRDMIGSLAVLPEIRSTNAWLLENGPPAPGEAAVCAADYQTHGRGRRGRDWRSPPGAGVCLSVGWQFLRPPARLQALGIAAGLALRDALTGLGVPGVMLKWPNDLLWGDRKLGGILVELRAEGNGPVHVVVGVGLNHRLPPQQAAAIAAGGGLAPVDLGVACPRDAPGRNRLAGVTAAALIRLLADYGQRGAALIEREWAAADAIAGRAVRVTLGEQRLEGVARGVDEDGALLLEDAGGLRRVTAGDVSLRVQT